MKARRIFVSLLVILILALNLINGCGSKGDSPSSAKEISAYSVNGIAGTINESEKTINVVIPFPADITALTATFTTTGLNVKIGSVVQESGVTANNFTNPLIYTVTAADGTTADYTVTVILSSEKAITSYSINGIAGTINETAKIISVTLPSGTDFTALVGTFATTGVSINVGTTAQVSGATANDFTLPVTYTVTAVDSSTQTYVVTVLEPWKIISTLKFYSSYSPSRLALQNGVAFLADGSIRIIDVSAPAASAIFSTISDDNTQMGFFDIMTNVSVSNNKILVGTTLGCNGWCSMSPFAGDLYTYDITNPANPVRTFSLGMSTGDIILDGNIAYVSQNNTQPQLNVIDTSVQPQASILGSVNIDAAGSLAKTGNLIFMAYNNLSSVDVLETINVINSASPSVLYDAGSGITFGTPNDRITICGNALYIAAGTNGLRIMDISNPASPSLVLTIPALLSISDVAVYNGYLYTADGASGIRVFDISNPLNPVYTRTIPTTPYMAKLVAVSGGVGVAVFKDTSNDYYFGVFLPDSH
jgi:hypothetical protein